MQRYDGNSALLSRQTYQYNTRTVSYGDATKSGDELQTDTTFVPNTSSYIVGLPAKVERRV